MGLDIELLTRPEERGHVSFSYGGFNAFRARLAESAGMGDLKEYRGYGGDKDWPLYDDEPLVPLLNHSDCEGELWGWQITGLADRILAVSRNWPKGEAPWASDRDKAEELAEVCRRCVEDSGVLVFG